MAGSRHASRHLSSKRDGSVRVEGMDLHVSTMNDYDIKGIPPLSQKGFFGGGDLARPEVTPERSVKKNLSKVLTTHCKP